MLQLGGGDGAVEELLPRSEDGGGLGLGFPDEFDAEAADTQRADGGEV